MQRIHSHGHEESSLTRVITVGNGVFSDSPSPTSSNTMAGRSLASEPVRVSAPLLSALLTSAMAAVFEIPASWFPFAFPPGPAAEFSSRKVQESENNGSHADPQPSGTADHWQTGVTSNCIHSQGGCRTKNRRPHISRIQSLRLLITAILQRSGADSSKCRH